MADVLIAGAGPAGATLAILLGRAGLRVDVFDARRFPREKPCGEGIMPAGVGVLERLGLREEVGGRWLRRVRYHGFGLRVESPFPIRAGRSFAALAQRRLRLDDVLISAARATPGVRVFEEVTVHGAVRRDGRAVGLIIGDEIRRGGLIVGADGIESPVRRSLGLERRQRRRSRIGVRMHFRLAEGQIGPDRLEIFMGGGYELYVAPLPDGELLLAALCHRDALADGPGKAFVRWIAAEPLLAEWLDGATPLTAPAGRAPVTRRARAGWAPGAVLLGDAAAATDPLTAGGIAHALVTAERLATWVPRILKEGDAAIEGFDRERRAQLAPHDWLTAALVFVVGRPLLARATMQLMRAAPPLMRALLGVGGGIEIQPPRLMTSAVSSAIPAPATSATDQNATLAQRAGSP